MALMREKADMQTQLEENEEDMSELMKKYKAAVQQVNRHTFTFIQRELKKIYCDCACMFACMCVREREIGGQTKNSFLFISYKM